MPFDGPDGYAAGLEALARAFEPRRALSISGWAAAYRILSGKSAAEPGRWRNERIPYLTAIMDALDPRHPAPIVVLVASSQIGKSECGLNWIGRQCHQMPGPFLVLFPTEKVARKWVRTRLDSMIATTAVLRGILPLGRRSSSGNTLQEKHGPGFVLYTGSANIPDDLASVSVPYLFLDEVDRMPKVLEGEGDPIELAMRRSATFPRRKCFMTSTPTTEEDSRIWPAWEASTGDRYFVPCGHCGHMQFLRWEQLKWPEGAPHKAAYACESCGALLEEAEKTAMLAAGEWRAEHPERAGEIKGFHINGLYTPIALGDSWVQHARAWERAKGAPERMQVFFNTRLGEVVKSQRVALKWETVWERREPYALRTIPKGVLVLTSGTDVQVDRLETQILGHGRGEAITVIDYWVEYGDPTRPEVWAKLDDYLAQALRNDCGVDMRLSCSLVDSNYLTDDVLNFTRTRKARHIYAARGSQIASRQPIGRPAYPDVKRRGLADKRGVERYDIGVSMLKHWLYERLNADADQRLSERHIRFSDALPQEYFRQLTAEVFDPKHGWLQRANYHRNEALDTFVLGRAAGMHHTVAVHRLRELDWQRLEQLYQPDAVPAKVDAPKFGERPIPVRDGFIPSRARSVGMDTDTP